MKLEVLDKTGKKLEELNLEKSVFGVTPNQDLISQYLHVYMSNQRQGTVATKTRGEVSGGGIKPWKQKGTGRARHGSRRSPIWVHGGIAHGPQPKSWKLELPKVMRKKVMQSVLSAKFLSGDIKVLDKLEVKKPSTKEVAQILKNLDISGKTLIVLQSPDQSVLKSTRNIARLETSDASNLNAYAILNAKNVLFIKDSLMKIQEKYK